MTEIQLAAADETPAVLAVGIDESGPLLDGISTRVLPLAVRETLESFVRESEPPAKPGEVRELPLPGQLPARVLVAGVGKASVADLRLAGAALGRAARTESLTVALPGVEGADLAALVEGAVLGGYRYEVKSERRVPGTVFLAGVGDAAAFERGLAYARGAVWARDLANTRTSTKTPTWVADQADRELTPLGVRVVARDAQWLAEQGFGGVLAVGLSSVSPPCLVEATWRPRGAPAGTRSRDATAGQHLVIVGKGITFDTGGYNLKPGESMKMMYTDMAGGAAALGALRVLAALQVPVRVTVLVPLAENAVSGSAMRPGDVVRHYGGRTTEIRNTDAEGRIVLADALAYAAARLRPTALVDIATLTGGVKVALGTGTAGYFGTSDDLAAALDRAASATGEPLWRLPFLDEHESQLDSDIADANNSAGNPQAITAAMFLRPFAGSAPWAHIDIAGTARAVSDGALAGKGTATGFGARLLASWAESHAAQG
ncbi:MAG TPA: leucyl aminopeptidase family protein [Jatrophihabitantaceae bacterium]